MPKADLPRGIRNNNPGNLKWDIRNRWQGLAADLHDEVVMATELDGTQTVSRMCIFETPPDGCRAMLVTFITYQDKRLADDGSAIDTVKEVIERWAPKGKENPNHGAYVESVRRHLGVQPGQHIDLHDTDTAVSLAKAMTRFENGCQPYSDDVWARGAVMAGLTPKKTPLQQDPAMKATKWAGGATLAGAALPSISDLVPALPLFTIVVEIAPWVIAAVAIGAIGYLGYRLWRESRQGLR